MPVAPDKRFMFDNALESTTRADVLDTYYLPYAQHTPRSVVKHRALTMAHPTAELYMYDKGKRAVVPYRLSVVNDAIDEWLRSTTNPIDVHK